MIHEDYFFLKKREQTGFFSSGFYVLQERHLQPSFEFGELQKIYHRYFCTFCVD